MSFVTTWIDLVGIILCEINQMKTDIAISLICRIKNKLIETETISVIARDREWRVR